MKYQDFTNIIPKNLQPLLYIYSSLEWAIQVYRLDLENIILSLKVAECMAKVKDVLWQCNQSTIGKKSQPHYTTGPPRVSEPNQSMAHFFCGQRACYKNDDTWCTYMRPAKSSSSDLLTLFFLLKFTKFQMKMIAFSILPKKQLKNHITN